MAARMNTKVRLRVATSMVVILFLLISTFTIGCKLNDDTIEGEIGIGSGSPPDSGGSGGGTAPEATFALTGQTIQEFDGDWGSPAGISNWSKRLQIRFLNSDQSSNLTNFPVLVRLGTDRIDYAQIAANGDDLRFYDQDFTALDYEIERWDPTGDSYIWVKVPQIDASTNEDFIWMYYGNSGASSGQNPTGVWPTSDYISVWHLGDLSDSSSNGNSGTDVNGSTASTGFIGNGRLLNGSNQYVSTSLFPDSTYRTLSYWVKHTSWLSNGELGAHDGSGQRRFYIGLDGTPGNLRGGLGSGFGAVASTMNLNEWYMLTLTGDGSNAKIYLNGQEVAGAAFAYTYTGVSAKQFLIGARNYTSVDGYIGGVVDEVRIASVDRSPDWVNAKYLSESDQFTHFSFPQNQADVVQTVVVNLTSTTTDAVTIPYTISGSSTAPPGPGADHSLSAGTLTIAGGASNGQIPLNIYSDLLTEGDETLVLTMGTPVNADKGSVDTHTITIVDKSSAQMTFPPPNPKNLIASVNNAIKVTLTWQENKPITAIGGYTISYQVGATAPANCTTGTVVDKDAVTGTTHSIVGLNPGTQYSFRVCATDTNNPVILTSSGVTATATTLGLGASPIVCSGGGDISTICEINDTQVFSDNDVIHATGDIIIRSGGSLQSASGDKISIITDGDITVETGASIDANLEYVRGDSVTIQAGAAVNADGLGFDGGGTSQSGQGPSPGVQSGGHGGGGAHGGKGSDAHGGAPGGDSPYGSVMYPQTMGSGGAGTIYAGPVGGNGGGVIHLTATNLVVNGSISANGNFGTSTGNGAAGGAGGSVWIDAANLSGSGTIEAKGGGGAEGIQENDSGSGGGGRMAIHLSGGYQFSGSISVAGGPGPSAARPGEEGSFFLNVGDLDSICDSGTIAAGCTVSSQKYIASSTDLSGLSSLTVTGTGKLISVGNASVTLATTGNILIQSGGYVDGPFDLLSADTLSVSGTLVGDISNLVSNAVSVSATGTITANIVDSTISGDFSVNSGGVVSASGRGFLGGLSRKSGEGDSPGSTPGISQAGGGGGHAGFGGDGQDGILGGQVIYGSATNPITYGSGGTGGDSDNRGGNGGGAIKLNVIGTTTIDGTVSVNGDAGTSYITNPAGGGAGGSFWLDTGTLVGSGVISAEGGQGGSASNYSAGGSGGGGRVAIYVGNSMGYAGTVSVAPGAVTGKEGPGGEGSFYLSIPSISDYLCDTGSLAGSCQTTAQKTLSDQTVTGSGNFTVGSGGAIKIVGSGSSVDFNLTGNLTVDSGGSINGPINSIVATDMIVNGSVDGDINSMTVDNLSVSTTGSVSANIPSGTVNQNLTVLAGGVISATGRGFRGGVAANNGQGNSPGAGGSSIYAGGGGAHGGLGGKGQDGRAGGTPTYGIAATPVTYGSGGGGATWEGGAGGGAIKFTVGGTMLIDGELSADGDNGTSAAGGNDTSGAGAGGSLWLDVFELKGSGQISAKGGSPLSTGSAYKEGGGGGGGRVALYITNDYEFSGTMSVAGGPQATDGYGGEEGSFYLSLSSADLLCDSGTLASSCMVSSLKYLPEGYAISLTDNLTVSPGGGFVAIGGNKSFTISSTSDVDFQNGSKVSGSDCEVTTTGAVMIDTSDWDIDIQKLTATDLTIGINGAVKANLYSAVVSGNTTVAGVVLADGRGHAGGRPSRVGDGPSGGINATSGSGAGNGGAGGANQAGISGGAALGIANLPIYKGSGGGGGNSRAWGGLGGGVVRLITAGTLSISGTLSVNGEPGLSGSFGAGGAGAGGSIWLDAGVLTGAGVLSATGANGIDEFSNDSGAGGGGVIGVYYGANTFTGSTDISGGTSPFGGTGGNGQSNFYNLNSPQTVFVTSATTTGDFGSLSAGDQICESFAHVQGLAGSWKALLSDSTTDASTRLSISGNVYNLRGDALGGPELLATSGATFWDSGIDAPVGYDEYGNAVATTPFTGTSATGVSSGLHCSDWSSGAGTATTGDTAASGATWLDSGSGSCGTAQPLYCVMQ